MSTFELLIKCKSRRQAASIAAHFQGDRPSEEFLADRIEMDKVEPIIGASIEFQHDIIIVNIE